MFNMRTQSVNVSRLQLIASLKGNLEVHMAEFAEAKADYEKKVISTLENALELAKIGDFSKSVVRIEEPASHEKDFLEVIEMMEMSVDETINLDREAFQAYFKNEWPWSKAFAAASMSYKL